MVDYHRGSQGCRGHRLHVPFIPCTLVAHFCITLTFARHLLVALKSYKTENNAKVGRANAVMSGVAKQFSKAELKELASYISGLPGELKTVPQNKFR
jgi:hypothetical protein